MTITSFYKWKTKLRNNRKDWIFDTVTLYNKRTLFLTTKIDISAASNYSGFYIEVKPNGDLSFGTFENAFPNITDAAFTQYGLEETHDFETACQMIRILCPEQQTLTPQINTAASLLADDELFERWVEKWLK